MERRMDVYNLFHDANFSGVIEIEPERLFKSDLAHMAKIEINEIGTVAAALTYLNAFPMSARRSFDCNHPFLFVIHDRKFNEILFAGIYHGPTV